MKRIICIIGILMLIFSVSSIPASAAAAGDYIPWTWAKSENGGTVTDDGNNTVTVSGKGVWDPSDIESLMGITFKQAVSTNGFKCTMTFNRFYGEGTTAGDGWYGIILNDKPYGITAPENYKAKNMKGIDILFKINKGSRARKQVIVELSTNGSDGLKSISGQSIIIRDLPNDWQVDVEIKGGKLYISGQLCYDLSKELGERLGSGKCYPTFAGFAEDYGDVSFTLKYDQQYIPEKGQPTTSDTKKENNSSTASATQSNTQSAVSDNGENVSQTSNDADTDSDSENAASEKEENETEQSITDQTDSIKNDVETDTEAEEETNSSDSIVIIAVIIAGVLIIGSVVACIFILKKGKGV